MILKPIDPDYICPIDLSIDNVFKNIFGFNDIVFIETDQAGAQLDSDPYSFFAINRVLAFKPITQSNNKYSSAVYDCLLTIAKPADPSQEVESVISVDGQFETITKEFLTLEFANTLRSYFICCDQKITINQIKPIWNSTIAAKRINHSGVEINLSIEI